MDFDFASDLNFTIQQPWMVEVYSLNNIQITWTGINGIRCAFQIIPALRSRHSVPCRPRLLTKFPCSKYPFAFSLSFRWYSSFCSTDEWEPRFDLERTKNWASTWLLLTPKDPTSGMYSRCSTRHQQQGNEKLPNEKEDGYSHVGWAFPNQSQQNPSIKSPFNQYSCCGDYVFRVLVPVPPAKTHIPVCQEHG